MSEAAVREKTASEPTIVVEKDGQIGWLVFNRPEAGNSLNARMLDELEEAWHELDDDPEVRVIVNTGNGSAFCTGLDMVQLAQDKRVLREHSRRTRDVDLRMTSWQLQIEKPVICAVNGVCAGGGLHFVADADIVVASSTASFVDPHVSVGQAVAYEAIALAKMSPMEPVMRMSLVGRHERMSVDRAYQLGIVGQVVDPPERLLAEVSALAERIARNSPTAMAATKRSLWAVFDAVIRPTPPGAPVSAPSP